MKITTLRLKIQTVMPDLTDMNVMDAIALLENMGLRVKFSGEGKVSSQSVAKGTKVARNTIVVLQCGELTNRTND